MADFIILIAIGAWCVYVISRVMRKKSSSCSGSCAGCSGCSAMHINQMIEKELERKNG